MPPDCNECDTNRTIDQKIYCNDVETVCIPGVPGLTPKKPIHFEESSYNSCCKGRVGVGPDSSVDIQCHIIVNVELPNIFFTEPLACKDQKPKCSFDTELAGNNYALVIDIQEESNTGDRKQYDGSELPENEKEQIITQCLKTINDRIVDYTETINDRTINNRTSKQQESTNPGDNPTALTFPRLITLKDIKAQDNNSTDTGACSTAITIIDKTFTMYTMKKVSTLNPCGKPQSSGGKLDNDNFIPPLGLGEEDTGECAKTERDGQHVWILCGTDLSSSIEGCEEIKCITKYFVEQNNNGGASEKDPEVGAPIFSARIINLGKIDTGKSISTGCKFDLSMNIESSTDNCGNVDITATLFVDLEQETITDEDDNEFNKTTDEDFPCGPDYTPDERYFAVWEKSKNITNCNSPACTCTNKKIKDLPESIFTNSDHKNSILGGKDLVIENDDKVIYIYPCKKCSEFESLSKPTGCNGYDEPMIWCCSSGSTPRRTSREFCCEPETIYTDECEAKKACTPSVVCCLPETPIYCHYAKPQKIVIKQSVAFTDPNNDPKKAYLKMPVFFEWIPSVNFRLDNGYDYNIVPPVSGGGIKEFEIAPSYHDRDRLLPKLPESGANEDIIDNTGSNCPDKNNTSQIPPSMQEKITQYKAELLNYFNTRFKKAWATALNREFKTADGIKTYGEYVDEAINDYINDPTLLTYRLEIIKCTDYQLISKNLGSGTITPSMTTDCENLAKNNNCCSPKYKVDKKYVKEFNATNGDIFLAENEIETAVDIVNRDVSSDPSWRCTERLEGRVYAICGCIEECERLKTEAINNNCNNDIPSPPDPDDPGDPGNPQDPPTKPPCGTVSVTITTDSEQKKQNLDIAYPKTFTIDDQTYTVNSADELKNLIDNPPSTIFKSIWTTSIFNSIFDTNYGRVDFNTVISTDCDDANPSSPADPPSGKPPSQPPPDPIDEPIPQECESLKRNIDTLDQRIAKREQSIAELEMKPTKNESDIRQEKYLLGSDQGLRARYKEELERCIAKHS